MTFLKLIASLLASYAAGAIGSLATIPNIPTWYAALDKPFFNPPNWVFGPVWNILYALIGISLFLIWKEETAKPKKKAYIVFGIQMILNALWSLVFFGLHQLWLGVIIIVLLLATIAYTGVLFHRIRPIASYLLIPYAAWVAFATCLTISLAVLN